MKRYSIYGEIPEKLWLEDVFANNKREALSEFKKRLRRSNGYAIVVLKKQDLPASCITAELDTEWNKDE